MTLYLSNRDGNGKTSEEGHYKFQTSVWSGSVLGINALKVIQDSPLGMRVVVDAGQFKIDTSGDYSYTGWNTSPEIVMINTADPANPRITTIVAYVDKFESTSPSPPNNPGIAKLISIDGTAEMTPSEPNDATVQAEIGASNPFIRLANIRVDALQDSVEEANITDIRSQVTLGNNLVSTNSIIDDTISVNKIKDNAVSTSKIQNSSVTTTKLADSSVSTSKLIDTSVTHDKIDWDTIPYAIFSFTTPTTGYVAGPGTSIVPFSRFETSNHSGITNLGGGVARLDISGVYNIVARATVIDAAVGSTSQLQYSLDNGSSYITFPWSIRQTPEVSTNRSLAIQTVCMYFPSNTRLRYAIDVTANSRFGGHPSYPYGTSLSITKIA